MEDKKKDNEIKLLSEPAKPSTDKRDFYVELGLFFILGILIGIAVKTEANKRITIGYNDYKMKTGIQQYSINNLQSDLLKKQLESVDNQDHARDPADGASCGSN